MSVPFLDLGRIHAPLAAELGHEFSSLIERGSFVNGAEVGAFEEAFAAYCGAAHCVGMSNGLDGLRLALLGSGLERGSEAIVPANTFIATVEAVSQAGLVPVLVDASESDYNLDIELAEAALTDRTSVLVPVHLYGQLADMRALGELARRRDLPIVEDACQAHGASRAGLRSGDVSAAAAFSFYPGKNLGAMGDAGAVVTEDADLAGRLRALREHGQREKYRHVLEGYTARLDTLQALVLQRKLPLLDGWNAQRRQRSGHLHVRARERRRPRSAADRREQRAGLAPVRRPHGRSGRPGGIPRVTRDRHGPALPGADPPVGRLPGPRLRPGRLPRHRATRLDRALAADLPRPDRR